MAEPIEIRDEGRVRLIRMNRPERKNALTHAMYASMADAITQAQDDDGVRVVALTGAGDAFTAGNDLQDFMASPPDLQAEERPPVQRFLDAIVGAAKPLVAIVNGVAVGVGTTLLLHCDFVYAARSARFSAPFVDLGLVPEAGSSLLMPRTIGPRRTAELVMLGERFDAEDALQCGLVTRVFDDGELMAKAEAVLARLAAKAPQSMRNTKALLRKDHDAIVARMVEEGELFAQALRGPEFREAATAFAQKRAPSFD